MHNMTCTTALTLVQGWEILYCEIMEKDWKEKFEDWSKKSKGAGTFFYSGYIQNDLQYEVKETEEKVYRGRILGRNPDKSLNSFPSCLSQSQQLCHEISISSNSRNLLQFM